jgi:LmbE family N-acetylglucosaminyl deacetylase
VSGGGPYTVVSFHAHPDDEALLTGGTLARAAADGHRVIIVVATNGEAGLTAGDTSADELGRRRRDELTESAAAIGAVRVVLLGHPDSGSVPRQMVGDGVVPFSALDPRLVADELAELLREESADVLTTYDAAGGYGHPDHVQVHRVGQIAAELAGTPLVLEATVDRELLHRVTRLLSRASVVIATPCLPDLDNAFTARAELTHEIDVRAHLDAKVRALRAHASQTGSDRGVRTLALLLRVPRPLRRRVLGTEWFREVGRTARAPLLDDVFATLRAEHGQTA